LILVEAVGKARASSVIAMNCAKVKQGSMLVLTDYELLAGAVPAM